MKLIKMLGKGASKESLIEKLNDLTYKVERLEEKLKRAECDHLNLRFVEPKSIMTRYSYSLEPIYLTH